MKKAYVVSFRNTNPRMNQMLRFLTAVNHGYAEKTEKIAEAKTFPTKEAARAEISKISKSNLYMVQTNIIDATIQIAH